ncbi:MAG: hypothetical protein V3T88_06165 [Nitrosomonadaceae bacterium]
MNYIAVITDGIAVRFRWCLSSSSIVTSRPHICIASKVTNMLDHSSAKSISLLGWLVKTPIGLKAGAHGRQKTCFLFFACRKQVSRFYRHDRKRPSTPAHDTQKTRAKQVYPRAGNGKSGSRSQLPGKIKTHYFTMALSRRKLPVSRNMFFVSFQAAHGRQNR